MRTLLLMISLVASLLLGSLAGRAYSQTVPAPARLPKSSESIIRQTSPASCGPATLATLFTFYFNDPVTERQMVESVGMRNRTTSTIKQLQLASIARGYLAKGFEMTLSELLSAVELVGSPIIVHFKEPTDHFVLVVGQTSNFVLISDPSAGQVSLDVNDFLRRWDRNVLVVTSDRPGNTALMELSKRSAETRIETLRRANSMMSSRKF